MRTKAAFTLYIFRIHLALAAAVVEGDVVPRAAAKLGLIERELPEIRALRSAHDRLDDSVPAGATIFIGDSHTQWLPVSAVAPLAINYGVGRQRTDHVLASMDVYEAMHRARAIFVMVGTNDISQGREEGIDGRYRQILAKTPASVPVYLSSIPPIADEDLGPRVRTVNSAARKACADRRGCTFVDTWAALTDNGRPRPGALAPDGVHLSPQGYALWAAHLRSVLTPG